MCSGGADTCQLVIQALPTTETPGRTPLTGMSRHHAIRTCRDRPSQRLRMRRSTLGHMSHLPCVHRPSSSALRHVPLLPEAVRRARRPRQPGSHLTSRRQRSLAPGRNAGCALYPLYLQTGLARTGEIPSPVVEPRPRSSTTMMPGSVEAAVTVGPAISSPGRFLATNGPEGSFSLPSPSASWRSSSWSGCSTVTETIAAHRRRPEPSNRSSTLRPQRLIPVKIRPLLQDSSRSMMRRPSRHQPRLSGGAATISETWTIQAPLAQPVRAVRWPRATGNRQAVTRGRRLGVDRHHPSGNPVE